MRVKLSASHSFCRSAESSGHSSWKTSPSSARRRERKTLIQTQESSQPGEVRHARRCRTSLFQGKSESVMDNKSRDSSKVLGAADNPELTNKFQLDVSTNNIKDASLADRISRAWQRCRAMRKEMGSLATRCDLLFVELHRMQDHAKQPEGPSHAYPSCKSCRETRSPDTSHSSVEGDSAIYLQAAPLWSMEENYFGTESVMSPRLWNTSFAVRSTPHGPIDQSAHVSSMQIKSVKSDWYSQTLSCHFLSEANKLSSSNDRNKTFRTFKRQEHNDISLSDGYGHKGLTRVPFSKKHMVASYRNNLSLGDPLRAPEPRVSFAPGPSCSTPLHASSARPFSRTERTGSSSALAPHQGRQKRPGILKSRVAGIPGYKAFETLHPGPIVIKRVKDCSPGHGDTLDSSTEDLLPFSSQSWASVSRSLSVSSEQTQLSGLHDVSGSRPALSSGREPSYVLLTPPESDSSDEENIEILLSMTKPHAAGDRGNHSTSKRQQSFRSLQFAATPLSKQKSPLQPEKKAGHRDDEDVMKGKENPSLNVVARVSLGQRPAPIDCSGEMFLSAATFVNDVHVVSMLNLVSHERSAVSENKTTPERDFVFISPVLSSPKKKLVLVDRIPSDCCINDGLTPGLFSSPPSTPYFPACALSPFKHVSDLTAINVTSDFTIPGENVLLHPVRGSEGKNCCRHSVSSHLHSLEPLTHEKTSSIMHSSVADSSTRLSLVKEEENMSCVFVPVTCPFCTSAHDDGVPVRSQIFRASTDSNSVDVCDKTYSSDTTSTALSTNQEDDFVKTTVQTIRQHNECCRPDAPGNNLKEMLSKNPQVMSLGEQHLVGAESKKDKCMLESLPKLAATLLMSKTAGESSSASSCCSTLHVQLRDGQPSVTKTRKANRLILIRTVQEPVAETGGQQTEVTQQSNHSVAKASCKDEKVGEFSEDRKENSEISLEETKTKKNPWADSGPHMQISSEKFCSHVVVNVGLKRMCQLKGDQIRHCIPNDGGPNLMITDGSNCPAMPSLEYRECAAKVSGILPGQDVTVKKCDESSEVHSGNEVQPHDTAKFSSLENMPLAGEDASVLSSVDSGTDHRSALNSNGTDSDVSAKNAVLLSSILSETDNGFFSASIPSYTSVSSSHQPAAAGRENENETEQSAASCVDKNASAKIASCTLLDCFFKVEKHPCATGNTMPYRQEKDKNVVPATSFDKEAIIMYPSFKCRSIMVKNKAGRVSTRPLFLAEVESSSADGMTEAYDAIEKGLGSYVQVKHNNFDDVSGDKTSQPARGRCLLCCRDRERDPRWTVSSHAPILGPVGPLPSEEEAELKRRLQEESSGGDPRTLFPADAYPNEVSSTKSSLPCSGPIAPMSFLSKRSHRNNIRSPGVRQRVGRDPDRDTENYPHVYIVTRTGATSTGLLIQTVGCGKETEVEARSDVKACESVLSSDAEDRGVRGRDPGNYTAVKPAVLSMPGQTRQPLAQVPCPYQIARHQEAGHRPDYEHLFVPPNYRCRRVPFVKSRYRQPRPVHPDLTSEIVGQRFSSQKIGHSAKAVSVLNRSKLPFHWGEIDSSFHSKRAGARILALLLQQLTGVPLKETGYRCYKASIFLCLVAILVLISFLALVTKNLSLYAWPLYLALASVLSLTSVAIVTSIDVPSSEHVFFQRSCKDLRFICSGWGNRIENGRDLLLDVGRHCEGFASAVVQSGYQNVSRTMPTLTRACRPSRIASRIKNLLGFSWHELLSSVTKKTRKGQREERRVSQGMFCKKTEWLC